MGKRPIGNVLTSLFLDRPISMLKTGREWCPDCLQEWQNSDREIYRCYGRSLWCQFARITSDGWNGLVTFNQVNIVESQKFI
jgi:hypothetical protein